MDTWLRFACGEPDHEGGLAHWADYEAGQRATAILGAEPGLAHDPAAPERRAWDGIL
jgi:carboxylesterase type B